MSLKRRDFIKIVSGSALALPLLDCSNKGYFSSLRKGKWAAGVEGWISSVCGACPGACGILVRVMDGKAVKIEGNPVHPVNRGKLCPLGQAGIQMLYNPDRIKGPQKKVGGRTSTQWADISWDEALDILATRLKKLKTAGEAHKFVLLTEDSRGMSFELLERFLNALGSPNLISDVPNASLVQAFALTQGINHPLAYDFENSNYIISFGAGILTSWPSPVQSMRALAYLRQGRPGKKAKIVQVEPRFSITASRSDKWVPIKPGTEGLLALGLAYVIIKENLFERSYVDNFTFGFDPWTDERGETHKGFGNLVLNNYQLDFVSEATGVSVDTIVTLAKEFAGNKPAVAVADPQATGYSNGLYNALAIHSLNALVGSIDVPGGVLVKRDLPLQEPPVLALDQATQKSLSQPRLDSAENNRYPLAAAVPSLIPDHILNGKPYPVELLFLCKSNPVFSAPNGEAFKKAFEKIPFIVSFSSFPDESAQCADLILPDKTYLEKHRYVESSFLSKIPVLGIGKPVIDNLYDTRATEDVFLDLAGRMGEGFAPHFPWKNAGEFLLYKIDNLFQARKGTIFTDAFEESQLKLLEERGWWVPQFSAAGEFKDELINKGGWWDPYYDFGVKSFVFKTPSKKFEFYSQIFALKMARLPSRPPRDPQEAGPPDGEARGDDVFMPHFEKPRFSGDEKDYPLYLHIHQPLSLSHSDAADQPWLQEIMGFHLNMNWDSWAEINPRTAEELGIRDHDEIWIESIHGKIRVIAKIYAGAMPEVVSLPLGLGHKALGRWARNRGVNPLDLVGPGLDEWTGQVLKSSARIKVTKA